MKKIALCSFILGMASTTMYSQTLIYKDNKQPIENRVEDLLSRMTLEEKIFQLNQYSFGENPNPNNIGKDVEKLPSDIGSLIYFSSNPKLRNEIQRKAIETSRLGIPILFGFDIIHGMRTVYPISLAQACSFNPNMVEQACRIAAKEAKLSGLDWTFSPMIDVSRDPRWGRVSESYGEDPYLNSVFGVASVMGYQGKDLSDKYSIAACLKHFVGYGKSEGGRDYRYTNISDQSLWETYLPPFENCIKAGAATVMSAFNDINGCPATANHYLLTEVLKEQWKHDGFVVSDWNAVIQLMKQGVASDKKEASYKAFTSGVDMDMCDRAYLKHLKELVKENKISLEQIDNSVRRIVRLKFRLGLFDKPYTSIVSEEKRVLNHDDIEQVLKLTEESIVLLKNENNALPLLKDVKNIALIGPMAKDKSNLLGSWSSHGKADDVTSIYEALEKAIGKQVNLTYSKGSALDGEDYSSFDEAYNLAKQADKIILCLGEDKKWSGENASRSTIALPKIQEELLVKIKEAGKPIILVLSNGRPLELVRVEPLVDAIVEMWQPGVTGGKALANILTGKTNPSGKLAITFPLTTGQIPTYYGMRQPARKMGDYQDIPTEPLYWFGHGLSYTSFEYSAPTLSLTKAQKGQKIIAEVIVSNKGKYAGKETVLWYVTDPVCSISRPMKELRYFEKQELKPGESKVFRFEIEPLRDLGYINSRGERFVETGEYYIHVGNHKLKIEII